jgi:hypothetical protein
MKTIDLLNTTTHGVLPQSYYNAINDIGAFDIVLIGDGDTFTDRISGTGSIGTNTASSGTINNRFIQGIDFNSTTSLANIGSVLSGTIPAAMTFSAWLAFDSWDSGAVEQVANIRVDASNEYRFFKFSSDAIFLYHYAGGTLTQQFQDVSTLTGINHIGFTVSASQIAIYVNGVQVKTGTPSAAPTGTLTFSGLGSLNGIVSNLFSGVMYDVSINTTTALDSATILKIYNAGKS